MHFFKIKSQSTKCIDKILFQNITSLSIQTFLFLLNHLTRCFSPKFLYITEPPLPFIEIENRGQELATQYPGLSYWAFFR